MLIIKVWSRSQLQTVTFFFSFLKYLADSGDSNTIPRETFYGFTISFGSVPLMNKKRFYVPNVVILSIKLYYLDWQMLLQYFKLISIKQFRNTFTYLFQNILTIIWLFQKTPKNILSIFSHFQKSWKEYNYTSNSENFNFISQELTFWVLNPYLIAFICRNLESIQSKIG